MYDIINSIRQSVTHAAALSAIEQRAEKEGKDLDVSRDLDVSIELNASITTLQHIHEYTIISTRQSVAHAAALPCLTIHTTKVGQNHIYTYRTFPITPRINIVFCPAG